MTIAVALGVIFADAFAAAGRDPVKTVEPEAVLG